VLWKLHPKIPPWLRRWYLRAASCNRQQKDDEKKAGNFPGAGYVSDKSVHRCNLRSQASDVHFFKRQKTYRQRGREAFSVLSQLLFISPLIPAFMQEEIQQEQQLNIELSEETADGLYANLAIINHSFAEFVIDFVNVMPNVPKAKVKSRLIMTPQHAKRLMRALIDNVKRFESTHGVIKDGEMPQMPITFGGQTGQA
jgi:hypothetical protein